jgi:hypothetical protein
MSNTLEELEERAAQLSPIERAKLALSLILSLDAVDEGDVDEAWSLEAEARLDQVESGKARLLPGTRFSPTFAAAWVDTVSLPRRSHS